MSSILKRFKEAKKRISLFFDEQAVLFEKKLDAEGFSEKQKEYVLWAITYALDSIVTGTILAIFFILKYGLAGIWMGILAWLAVLFAALATRERSNRAVYAILCFMLAVLCANWFFDDIKKTLAFPLAFLCYSLGKKLCPGFIQSLLDKAELIILGRSVLRESAKEALKKAEDPEKKNAFVKRRSLISVRRGSHSKTVGIKGSKRRR